MWCAMAGLRIGARLRPVTGRGIRAALGVALTVAALSGLLLLELVAPMPGLPTDLGLAGLALSGLGALLGRMARRRGRPGM